MLRRALGNTQQGGSIFPATALNGSSSSTGTSSNNRNTSSGPVDVQPSRTAAAKAAAVAAGCLQPVASSTDKKGCARAASSSKHDSRGCSRQHGDKKLAHRIVETCVHDVFAGKAEANMQDGSFNPGLSLQQSADYEAVREVADLERRLERGMVSE